MFYVLGTNEDVPLFPKLRRIKTRSEEKTLAEKTTPEFAMTEPIDLSNVQIEFLFENYVDFETFSKSDLWPVKVLK